MRVSKARLREFSLLLVFKALLDVVYIFFVHPYYGYSGFSMQLDGLKLLESYLFLISLFFFLPRGEHRISAVGIKLLFIMMVAPTLSLYAMKNESRAFMYLFIGGFWLTLLTVQILPRVRVARVKKSSFALCLGLGIVSFSVYVALFKIRGVPTLHSLNLSLVYEVRSVFVHGLPRMLGYLVPWQANVINSFLIGLAWYRRRYLGVATVLALQLLLFLFTGAKSFLFAPALVSFLFYAVQKKRFFELSLKSFIIGTSFSFVFHALGGSIMVPSVFIRRLFFVPAQNYFYYYDFFSHHQLTYLSQSILNPFFANPYGMRITNMIGSLYYGQPTTSVNTGYLADAYMNFGALGVVIFSVFLGVFLVILDSLTKRTNTAIAMAVIAVPLVSLVNSSFFTTLLTHGFLLSMLVLWLYSRGVGRSVMLTTGSRLAPQLEVMRK